MNHQNKYELVIIGAGPGGYRAAFLAADLGMNVCLIDSEANPGGVCLYRGCIPTKALLHLVKIKNEAEHAHDIGLEFSSIKVDLQKAREWKNRVVSQLTDGLGQLVQAHKINYIQAHATFMDSHSLELTHKSGDTEKISFVHAIIATGVKPVALPGIPAGLPSVMTSAQLLELASIPESLLVIGGGYIGLEMATIYGGLGTKVSVVELTADIMQGMDADLVAEYKKASKGVFSEIFLETKVTQIEEDGTSLRVTFESKQKEEFNKTYSKVLVSVGQEPNTKGLGLEHTAVITDHKGFIKVNAHQQTSEKHIYAIGDIAGPPLLAHKASYEGRVAVECIAGKKSVNDAKAIPAVIYTSPEIATCGLTESQANEKGLEFRLVKFPWKASGRALAMNEKAGFTKLIVQKKDGRILGAGIVGNHAGDLIAELVLAIEMGATAEDISLTMHPHPTLSETIMEAAEIFNGHPTHIIAK